MSIADFILAFVGIIIGLGVADLLVSVHKLLRAGRRVKWHWATPALAILMLLVTLILWWWSFIWFSGLQSETIARFLPKFGVLVVSFLMMAAALPDEVPESGLDLREFYFSTRVHLWSLMSITLGSVVLVYFADNWSLGVPRILNLAAFPIVSFVLAVIATCTARMWVHAVAITWIFAATIYNNLFFPIGQ
jgi:hypothetical protein